MVFIIQKGVFEGVRCYRVVFALCILRRKLLLADHLHSYNGIPTTHSFPIQLSYFCLAIVANICCAFKIVRMGCEIIWQLRNVFYTLLGLLHEESLFLAIAI